jgi:hypothetical protein
MFDPKNAIALLEENSPGTLIDPMAAMHWRITLISLASLKGFELGSIALLQALIYANQIR